MDMSPTGVGYKFRSLALANCPINSSLLRKGGLLPKMLLIFLFSTKSLGLVVCFFPSKLSIALDIDFFSVILDA